MLKTPIVLQVVFLIRHRFNIKLRAPRELNKRECNLCAREGVRILY